MSLVEKNVPTDENEITVRDPQMNAIAKQFSSRGLASSIRRDTEAQIAREEETQASEPEAYRLSQYSEEYISARYRHGKELMSGDDLMEYFREMHERRTKDADFSAEPPKDELVRSGDADKPCKPVLRGEQRLGMRERLSMMPQTARELPARTWERVKLSYPSWFDGSKADTSKETRRFPLSAFAAILAVAMSLTLVVASSVMIHHGESRLNSLKLEASALSSEILEMRSDLSAETDLLAIRDVAVNEFGMVSEEFVRQEYLTEQKDDSIVIYEEKEEQMIGLSALLNALGIK